MTLPASDFIPENQAAKLAGVSETTLSRFVEAGYLKTKVDSSGVKTYSKNELKDIFGLSENIEIEVVSSNFESEQAETLEESTRQTSQESDNRQPEGYWAETITAPEGNVQDTPAAATESAELIKLRSISEMQEKILEMREHEIQELRKERDWLKARVERHEEKSDRDQLLLLSETQMIRKLVAISQQKKPSAFRLALEWMGLAAPTPQQQDLPFSPSKEIETK